LVIETARALAMTASLFGDFSNFSPMLSDKDNLSDISFY